VYRPGAISRLKNEVMLAPTDPTIGGRATYLYSPRQNQAAGVKVQRIARGGDRL